MPSENWGNQKEWPPKSLGKANSNVEHKIVEKDTLKEKLEVMDMGELRDYVKQHGLKAKDTRKEELIREILEEVNK